MAETGRQPTQNSENHPKSSGEGHRKGKRSYRPFRPLDHAVSAYVEGIRKGNRLWLSRAITLVESRLADHQALGAEVVDACLPYSGKSIRIGITGAPGVGKSTFIEQFGLYMIEVDRRVAVLAIDPSSQSSGGSILGDKTRMELLTREPTAFVRPTAAGGSLGGVAHRTREVIFLCEAAGFDTVLVETVGVGQSEIAVASMTDFFLLLLMPGAGDELQGIKRGIVELADLVVVNKADGDRIEIANAAKRAYRNALHLFPPHQSGWVPKVLTGSGLHGKGLNEVWQQMQAYQTLTENNGFWSDQRRQQNQYWLEQTLQREMLQLIQNDATLREELEKIRQLVASQRISPTSGVRQLLSRFQLRRSD